jgi:hypothetical protein
MRNLPIVAKDSLLVAVARSDPQKNLPPPANRKADRLLLAANKNCVATTT